MGFWDLLETLFTSDEPNIFEKMINYKNKGQFGEYLTSYALKNIDGYFKILCNVYVPYRGKTSEIDILLLHEKGVFVFESKNYSGWIFGSADQKNWTQCLNKNSKNKFYNPIMQNRTHINALSTFTKMSKDYFSSYIIFSDKSEFKKVPEDCNEYVILHRAQMLSHLKNNIKNKDIIFSNAQIDNMYNHLYPLTTVTEQQKQEHINNIKEKLK